MRARPLQESGETVEEPEACGFGSQRTRQRGIGPAVSQLGEHAGDVGGGRAHLDREGRRLAVSGIHADGLKPGPVRGRPFSLVAAPREHPGASPAGMRRDLAGQPGLADAGLTGEEHHATAAPDRVLDRPAELIDFMLPADEGGAG